VLQDPARYQEFEATLYKDLAELAAYGKAENLGVLGVEQMYTPHQIPWTVAGAEKLLREVYRLGGAPFYLTVDVGHMNGQRKFVRPTNEKLYELHERFKAGDALPELWLGPEKAVKLFEASKELPLGALNEIMDEYPHMFAPAEDGDPYHWLEKLGGYSPIIHLQQADGKSSPHWAFTKENNARGIVEPEKVLAAIKRHYDSQPDDSLPPLLPDLYLTLEIFAGTADLNRAVLQRIRESVVYWRKTIPEDGLTLDKLI
jgi:sugar phosphate isomerase/epimerase